VEAPGPTITTAGTTALVQTEFLLKYNSMNQEGKHTPPSIEDPAPVVAAQSRLGLVQSEFLAAYYGNGDNTTPVTQPCPTVVTKDRFAIVQPEYFIDKHYGQASQNQSIDAPSGAIMPNDKHRLVECDRFIMPTHFDNQPQSIEDPLGTITAWHYLVNPSWGGHPGSVDTPCPVVIARQDKAPLYLIEVNTGEMAVPVYEDDSEPMIRIKQFMAAYRIVDIKMRMLRVLELLRIQGFPEGYQLAGTQTDQKKFIGNSVVPIIPKVWAEAMHEALQLFTQKIA
jgi:DNA (cytosine-5)-methyltransferase 1